MRLRMHIYNSTSIPVSAKMNTDYFKLEPKRRQLILDLELTIDPPPPRGTFQDYDVLIPYGM